MNPACFPKLAVAYVVLMLFAANPNHCIAGPSDSSTTILLYTGTIEIGFSGTLTSIEGNTSALVMFRGGWFFSLFQNLFGLELALAFTRVHSLKIFDIQSDFSWQKQLGSTSLITFLSLGGGLRQEWLGGFRQARIPIGGKAGFKIWLNQSSAIRTEYSFRRLFDDPVENFNEHQILIGISIFLRNKPKENRWYEKNVVYFNACLISCGEKMRRVLYSVAASLDGYIAGPNGEFDWIPDEPAIDWQAFMSRFDTVLMGRHTYEVAASQGPSSGMRTYVFSRTLRPEDHPRVTVVAAEAERVVRELRAESGKDIWLMGGGVLFRSLLNAGLVDAVEVGLVPILLGGGLPLLPVTANHTRLRLTGTKTYPSGIILLNYEVERTPA